MTVAELGFRINSQPVSQATRELDRLKTASSQCEKEVQRLGTASANAMGFLRAFGTQFLAAFASTQTLRVIREVADQVAKIGENARMIGVTARELQVLRYAVLQNGGAATDADKAYTAFVQKIGEARTQQGYLYRLLRENGVALKDRSIAEVWSDFLDILKRAPDEATRLRMATRVLGTELGQTFAKLAVQGPGALQQAYRELQRAGAILTDDQINSAQKIDEEWKKLEYTIGMRVKGAIVNVAAATRSIIEEFGKLPPWVQQAIQGAAATNVAGAAALAIRGIVSPGGNQSTAVPPNLPRVNINTGTPNAGRTGFSRDPGTRDITNEYTRLQKSLEKQIVTLQAEAATYGQGEYAIEKYRVQQQLLLVAEQAKLQLTPQLRAQIEKTAEAYGKAADAAARMRLRTDLAFERYQFGRGEIEANVASRLRSAGLPVDLQSAEANLIRINEQLRISKDLSTDFALDFGRTLRTELANGAKGFDALSKAGMTALSRLSDKLMDMAIQNLVAKAFGGSGFNLFGLFGSGASTGASTGMSSGIDAWSGLRLSRGGYTGPGGKYTPAGIVHKGEYVFDQASVRAAGGPAALDRVRSNLKGYSDGGYVDYDRVPSPYREFGLSRDFAPRGAASGPLKIAIGVTFDGDNGFRAFVKSTSDQSAQITVEQYDKALPDRVQQIENDPRRR
jgi:hypothetical protein